MTAPIEVDVTTSPIEVTVTSEPPVEVTTALTGTFVEGGGAEQLSELSDVGVTTPTDKNALMADGSLWESRALVEGDISDLGSYIDTTGVTFENLDTNSDVGTGVSQVAAGNHTHSGVYEPAGVSAADITDSTADGRALLTSADANPFTDANASTLGTALQPDDADIGEAIEDTDKSHVFNTSASASVTATFSRLWTWILSKMPFASQAEMEAGTETSTRSMSPERVKQAIDALSSGGDLVDDLTPQLGGDLDLVTHSIVTTSNRDITLTPNGTGNIVLGTVTLDADQTVGAGQDNYVLTYDNATGLLSLEEVAAGGDYEDGGEAGGADRTLGNTDSFDLGFLTNNTTRLHVQSDGNVGIGTDSPQNLLDVNAGAVIGSSYAGVESAPTDGLLVEGNVGVGTASPDAPFNVDIDYSGVMARFTNADAAYGPQFALNSTATNGAEYRLVSRPAGDFGIWQSGGNSYRLYMLKTGEMGIGTITPQNKLDVSGAGVFGSSYAGVETAPTDGLLVEGNVGIGTTAPDTLLDINGAVTQRPLSADPSDPDDGNSVQWVSDGTGSGDAGDVMMKITVGATTKTITVADFSAA